MKIETKIQMKVGQKTLELTPQEARELRDALNAIVGHIEYRPYYWTYPTTIYPTVWTTGTLSGTAGQPYSVTTSGSCGTTATVASSALNASDIRTYTLQCGGNVIDN
jgi:hypothetical protein